MKECMHVVACTEVELRKNICDCIQTKSCLLGKCNTCFCICTVFYYLNILNTKLIFVIIKKNTE